MYDKPNRSPGPGNKLGLRYKNYKLLFGGAGKPDGWMTYDHVKIDTEDPITFETGNDGSRYSPQLYDMKIDPFETNNIYYMNDSKIHKIKEILFKWKEKLEKSTQTIFAVEGFGPTVQSMFKCELDECE